MKPSAFLAELWGETPGAPMLVWTLPDRKSHWLESPADADQDWGECDVYTSVSLPMPDAETPPGRRVKSAEAGAIAGLWADVDYTDEAHTKPGLPAEADALRVLLQDVETPTILVRSGHGYQAWWLFETPWVFADDGEREEAQRLVQWWQASVAQALDATMDSTHDLARVLRLPGTTNRKREPFVEVTADVTGERRARELWARDAESSPPSSNLRQSSFALGAPAAARNGAISVLLLTSDREPSSSKLELLKEAIPEVGDRLKHRGLQGDQSLSGYDLSLASYAVQVGWTDQEIVDLCIMHRGRHKGDLKLDRPDYWERTLHAARSSREPSVADIIEQPLDELGGLGIHRVLEIRDPSHPDAPTYRLISDRGVLELPSVTHLTRQLLFRDACFVQLRKFPSQMKNVTWENLVRRLMEAAETIEPGHPDHPRTKREPDETREWVEAYLRQTVPSPNIEEGETLGVPFLHEGRVHFVLHGLRQWLRVQRDERVTYKRLSARLRDIGAENVRVRAGDAYPRCWRLDDADET